MPLTWRTLCLHILPSSEVRTAGTIVLSNWISAQFCSTEKIARIYIYICCIKKTVLVKKRHFYIKKLVFYKLNGCKNTAFQYKIYFCKKAAFLCKKSCFFTNWAVVKKNCFFTEIYFCKKAAFLCKNPASFFYKLISCKKTAFLQKYIFVKKRLFLCKKSVFLQNIFLYESCLFTHMNFREKRASCSSFRPFDNPFIEDRLFSLAWFELYHEL